MVAAEDQRFLQHRGFDFAAIKRAHQHNQRGRQVRGASTITQQLAKNLFLWGGRSYARKALEAWYTLWIEALWPKRRILEVYVNVVEFGDGVYGALKFESGGHRVQRVPATETQGRIHTSACTVAVMAEADEIAEVVLNPADLRIDTYRASGAGGQHINKTDSAVRITHLPTGIVAECQDGRSQHANKASAMQVLAARIYDIQLREKNQKEAAERKSLIGSGDRSERIRTYNFPQGRLTDHRINLTLYKLSFIMEGDLEEVTQSLQNARQAEQLADLESSLPS